MIAVTRVRAGASTGGYDEQGNPIAGADSAAVIEVWAFAPQVSDETAQAFGAEVIDAGTVYADKDVDLLPADRLLVHGETWQVEGNPRDWVSPFGSARSGSEILVRRVS